MDFLSFLGSPIFVVPWFGFGLVAAFWVFIDVYTANKNVNQALKLGWPILIVFFSIIGLLLYLWTCRPPWIINQSGEQAQAIHHEFVSPMGKKVTGSEGAHHTSTPGNSDS